MKTWTWTCRPDKLVRAQHVALRCLNILASRWLPAASGGRRAERHWPTGHVGRGIAAGLRSRIVER
eukprot:10957395-Alexandrium_andersonii.AAC.1